MNRYFSDLAFCAVALAAVGFGAFDASAKLDKGFIEKSTKEIWATEQGGFDPKADMTDTLFTGESAAFIAINHKLEAYHYNERDMSKYAEFGTSRANAIDARYTRRYMVLLNDAKAVETFGDFSFDIQDDANIGLYNIMKIRHAFGARIHRPDGSISDVDISEAYAIEEGKKNKDSEYKIAIPGLEPGCVLEYYYMDDYHIDELDMPAITINLLPSYPAKMLTVECRLSPELTTEYKAYNNAEPLTMISRENGITTLGMGAYMVDKRPSESFVSPMRQYPFYRFRIKNNLSQVRRYPQSRRGMGIHGNVTTDQILSDGAFVYSNVTLPSGILNKANGYLKDWKKAHPAATDVEESEAALMATRLATLVAKELYSPEMISLVYVDLLDKIKHPEASAMGVVSSRDDVPLDRIMSFDEPTSVVRVGERIYFPGSLIFAPGEFGFGYDGEPAKFYGGSRANYVNYTLGDAKMPASRPKDNTITLKYSVDINPDSVENVAVNVGCKATGSLKPYAFAPVNRDEIIGAMEDYLDVADGDRHKSKTTDSERREARLKGLKALSGIIMMAKTDRYRNFSLSNVGMSAENKALELGYSLMASDLVEADGDDLIVNVGKLIPEPDEILESQRAKRDMAIVLPGVSVSRYSMTINVPEGYEADADEIAALSDNIQAEGSTYYAEAKVGDDGNISVTIQERDSHAVLPSSQWASFVKCIDAKKRFSESTFTLRKK